PNISILEVGPGSSQSALIAQHSAFGSTHEVIASIGSAKTSSAGVETIMRAVGQLWTLGHKVDWHRFHAHENRRRVRLPTYPFERQRFWIDPDADRPSGEQAVGTQESRPPDLLFREVWKRAELPAATTSGTSGSWLIFRDEYGLGDSLIEYLRTRGEHC